MISIQGAEIRSNPELKQAGYSILFYNPGVYLQIYTKYFTSNASENQATLKTNYFIQLYSNR